MMRFRKKNQSVNLFSSFRDRVTENASTLKLTKSNDSHPDGSQINLDVIENVTVIEKNVASTSEAFEALKTDQQSCVIYQIDETFEAFSRESLKEVGESLQEKQIVALQSSVIGAFYVLWKCAELHVVGMFDNIKVEDLREICKFIVEFLGRCLQKNHSGIKPSKVTDKLNLTLVSLANPSGLSLLFYAAQNGRKRVVEILLAVAFSVNDLRESLLPADYAYVNLHYDTLLVLLHNNSMFPCGFDVNACPNEDIKAFVSLCVKFHEDVKKGNTESLKQSIEANPNLRYFYSTLGQSAAAAAIAHRKFDIYELLLQRNVFLSVYEYIDDITASLEHDERREMREIHFRNKKNMQDSHLNVLMAKSFVGHDVHNVQSKLDHVARAFRILYSFFVIQILLKIAAMLRDLHIVFDFNRDSVQYLDPTQDHRTLGLFYGNGRIYVGARQLLNPNTQHEVLATLAHEICHFVLYNVFGREARPYDEKDRQAAIDFERVSRECAEKKTIDKIIGFVYDCYPKDVQHAELIVRVPHFYAHYHDQPEVIESRKSDFASLFDFFEKRVVPRLEKELVKLKAKAENEIEEKDRKISMLIKSLIVVFIVLSSAAVLVGFLVYEPHYNWSSLDASQKSKVFNTRLTFEGEEARFDEIYGRNESSGVFAVLNTEQLKKMLKNQMIDLSDPRNAALENEIYLVYSNMSESLRKRITSAELNFQGHRVEIGKLLANKSENFLSLLGPKETLSLFKNKSFAIGTLLKNETLFYVERRFISPDREIFYTKWDEQKKITVPQYSDEEKRNFSLTSNMFIDESFNSRLMLLSDDAGTGKTTTFKNLALEMKKKFPLMWIEYVDLKAHIDVYKSAPLQALEMLRDVFKLDDLNYRVFEDLYESDSVIILWDGFDEISPTFSGFIVDRILAINEQTKNIQLISTRPQYQQLITNSLNTTVFKLLSYLTDENQEFLYKFYALKRLSEPQIRKATENAKKLAEKIQQKDWPRKETKSYVESPLLLQMIAEVSLDSKNSLDVTNLYTIYESFVNTKVAISVKKGGLAQNETNTFLTRKTLTLREIFQCAALKVLFDESNNNLTIMKRCKEQKDDTVDPTRYGILIYDYTRTPTFVHRTFAEFFVAQFFVDSIYEMNDAPRDEEIIARIKTMIFVLIIRYETKIHEFVEDFLIAYKPVKLAPGVKRIFESKMRTIFYDMLSEGFKDNSFDNFNGMLKVFPFERDTLETMWDLHEDTTFFAWWASMMADVFFEKSPRIAEIINMHFGDDKKKMEKLMFGNNQLGNLLFGAFNRIKEELLVNKISIFPTDEFLQLTRARVVFETRELSELENITQFYEYVKPNLTREEICVFFKTNFVDILRKEKLSLWSEIKASFSLTELQELIYTNAKGRESILYYLDDFDLIGALFETLESTSNTRFNNFLYRSNGDLLFNKKTVMVEDNFETIWKTVEKRTSHEEKVKFLSANLVYSEFSNGIRLTYINLFTASIDFGEQKVFEFVKSVYTQFFNQTEMKIICVKALKVQKEFLPYAFKPKPDTIKAFVDFLRSLFTLDEIKSQLEVPLRELYALYGSAPQQGFTETNFALFDLLREIVSSEDFEKMKNATHERSTGVPRFE